MSEKESFFSKKDLNLVVMVLLIVCICILGYILFYKINFEGAECTLDPIGYGLREIQEANTYPVECSCRLLAPGGSEVLFFNSTDTWSLLE